MAYDEEGAVGPPGSSLPVVTANDHAANNDGEAEMAIIAATGEIRPIDIASKGDEGEERSAGVLLQEFLEKCEAEKAGSARRPRPSIPEEKSVGILVQIFWKCMHDDHLTLQEVREHISRINPRCPDEIEDGLRLNSLLHPVCANKSVTLEIVEAILEFHPDAADMTQDSDIGSSYPLHAACWNPSCPLSVIKLLAAKNLAALSEPGIFANGLNFSKDDSVDSEYQYEYIQGTPLHYYLQRKSNMTVEGAKFLLEAFPGAMRTQQFSFLHGACASEQVQLEIIELILDLRPDDANETQDVMAIENGSNVKIGSSYPLHAACWNPGCPLSVIKLLVEKNPDALGELGLFANGLILSKDDFKGKKGRGTPLHYYLQRESNLTVEGVEFLVDAFPESMRILDEVKRLTPLHVLALNPKLSDHLEMVRMLIRFDPSMLQMMDSMDATEDGWWGTTGSNPIHHACCNGDATLDVVACLVENWPGSIREGNWEDMLPLHCICQNSELDDTIALDIMMFLVHQDPTTVRQEDSQRNLPIHFAAGEGRRNRACCEFLISHFPESVRATNVNNRLPFQEAFKSGRLKTVTFFEKQTAYATKASSFDETTALDKDGRLLLHNAICDRGASLGSIKLLVKGNPSALQTQDNKGLLPAHLACLCRTPDIVKYLVEMDQSALRARDAAGNNLLHHACRSGNFGAVKYLLGKCLPLVSSENKFGVLPIHLLCDKSGKNITKSAEYADTIWRMLLAHPETVSRVFKHSSAARKKIANQKRKSGEIS